MTKLLFDPDKCTLCGICADICPNNAIELGEDMPHLMNADQCSLCGICEDQCPVHAITIPSKPAMELTNSEEFNNKELFAISKSFVGLLDLRKAPVGVKLLKPADSIPQHFKKAEMPLRHCVSVHMASLGASLHLPADAHACVAARAAFGISDLPEKVKSGKVPYMHGLAASVEAAARIMAEVPKLDIGSAVGTLVGPLQSYDRPPDVVILTCLPKQAMWIANALIYDSGGPRIVANFAGMQACCGDSTTIPIKTGNVNFSLGCYGCRYAGKLRDNEMYVGIPWVRVQSVVNGLIGLRKAMGKPKEYQIDRS